MAEGLGWARMRSSGGEPSADESSVLEWSGAWVGLMSGGLGGGGVQLAGVRPSGGKDSNLKWRGAEYVRQRR